MNTSINSNIYNIIINYFKFFNGWKKSFISFNAFFFQHPVEQPHMYPVPVIRLLGAGEELVIYLFIYV